ncbi:MAG: T9SS type A sorting domain-containing protein [Saprospiraceae bacterium]|nr:T9SS type A sorting domain-containing protein [Saprospiraceae bacterium]
MKRFLFLWINIIPFLLFAQPTNLTVMFQDLNGDPYDFALTGGLNNPQFSEIDLDGDGDKDLVYFDRQGFTIVPFLNGGTPNGVDYTYAPEYIHIFPKVERWMLLRDYNCDLLEDLFAYKYDSNTGKVSITVYEASRDIQNKVQFTMVKNIIEYHLKGQSTLYNLFNSTVDLPAIDDIDGDGDMDILNFNSSGGYVEMFQNESQENGFGCDSLIYVYYDNCWGRIYESGITEFIDLSPVNDSCPGYPGWTPIKSARHAGSTLLTIDMDNDGDKELMLGDLSFKNINLLTNGGNADTAHLISQEMFFPQNSSYINIDIFPAVFNLDVNNDGAKDLIAAPNIGGNAEDDQNWFYQNTATTDFPVFTFQKDDFLVDQMIDLGTGSAPTFFDYNGDGLMDIVVGNDFRFVNSFLQESFLYLYENIGTSNQPIYRLVNTDFADMKQYNLSRLTPTFGDLDNDGDKDLLMGEENGGLIYIVNQGTVTAPVFNTVITNYANIDVGQKSTPQLVDADRDGDLDLIIGERNGNINYYENTGTVTLPVFSATATSETFGFIDAKLPGTLEGNSAPFLIDYFGEFMFFVGSESGELWMYNNIDGNLSGPFNRVNNVLDSIDVGEESVLAIANINNDTYLEFLIGNKRGGLQLYSESFATSISSLPVNNNLLKIYPNPTSSDINIKFTDSINEVVLIKVYNMLGQKLYNERIYMDANTHMSLKKLMKGTYILSVTTSNGMFIERFIKN